MLTTGNDGRIKKHSSADNRQIYFSVHRITILSKKKFDLKNDLD